MWMQMHLLNKLPTNAGKEKTTRYKLLDLESRNVFANVLGNLLDK